MSAEELFDVLKAETPKNADVRPKTNVTNKLSLNSKTDNSKRITDDEKNNFKDKKRDEVNKTSSTFDFVLKNIHLIEKIRKCCVKLPKDKGNRLKKLQKKTKIKEKTQKKGKPKKKQKEITKIKENKVRATRKRKATTDNKDSSSPSNKKRKISPPSAKQPNRIYIKLPRGSSRAKPIEKSTKLEKDTKRKVTQKNLKIEKNKFSKSVLRKKFGNKYFQCHIRLRNVKDVSQLVKKKSNKSGKSVSFVETVEVFGESSDDEISSEFDQLNSNAKNASNDYCKYNKNEDVEKNETLITSTPVDGKKKGRKSFSPLKENSDPSPRKEILKRANEKMPTNILNLIEDEEIEDGEEEQKTDKCENDETGATKLEDEVDEDLSKNDKTESTKLEEKQTDRDITEISEVDELEQTVDITKNVENSVQSASVRERSNSSEICTKVVVHYEPKIVENTNDNDDDDDDDDDSISNNEKDNTKISGISKEVKSKENDNGYEDIMSDDDSFTGEDLQATTKISETDEINTTKNDDNKREDDGSPNENTSPDRTDAEETALAVIGNTDTAI